MTAIFFLLPPRYKSGGACLECSNLANFKCKAGEFQAGQCAGATQTLTCNTCDNTKCGADSYRMGSCSGTNNGFSCTPQPKCKGGQYLSGPSSFKQGKCTTCSNVACQTGQYRTGECTGTKDGFQCPAQPTCLAGSFLKGAGDTTQGICTLCSNAQCPGSANSTAYRDGDCSGANDGYRCEPQPTCKAGEYLQGSGPTTAGMCSPCKNPTCGAGEYRSGTCAGTADGYECTKLGSCQANHFLDGATAVTAGDCKPCANTVCDSSADGQPGSHYRVGACGGDDDGFLCTPRPTCAEGQYLRLDNAANVTEAGHCTMCANTTCKIGQYRAGSCGVSTGKSPPAHLPC